MRIVPLAATCLLGCALSQASAQPKPEALDRALITTNVAYDDLSCAARYTLAAFVVQSMDTTAAAYYSERADAAGQRYLQMHPGETEQAYTSRVKTTAEDLQERLTKNSLTPETLVSDIKQCDANSDTLIVL